MKKHIIIFLISLNTFGQTNELFKVEYIESKKDNQGNGFYSLKPITNYFYEDENYIVTDSCRGEFGGNTYFKEKSSGLQYSLAATCPLIINKLKNKYYLTTSLAHMSGSCGLYEIENPKELVKVDILDYNNYTNKESVLGAKPLIHENSTVIMLSFIYKEKLYHIVSNRNETYLAERENTELKTIQKLTDFGMYSYGSEVCKTTENRYAAIFQTNKMKQGFIEVYNDKIKITVYQ